MQLGILTKAFEGTTPAAVLQAARAAGYETVQYSMTSSGVGPLPEVVDDEAAGALRSASKESGVSIAAVSAVYNMIHSDVREREKGRKSVRAIAAAAHQMGTSLLTVCTGTRDTEDMWRFHPENSSTSAWQEMIAEFGILLAIAEEYDVRLGVEPELANVICSAEKARQMLDELGTGRVRIVLDAANLFEVADPDRRRYLVEHAVDLLGDSIEIAHAKDRMADGQFCTAGKGVLEYGHYFRVLRSAGFRGPMITHGLTAAEAPGVAEFLRREAGAIG